MVGIERDYLMADPQWVDQLYATRSMPHVRVFIPIFYTIISKDMVSIPSNYAPSAGWYLHL